MSDDMNTSRRALLTGGVAAAATLASSVAVANSMRHLFEAGHSRILVAYLGDGIANVAERLDGVRNAVAEHER